MSLRIALLAAEPSADLLGAGLIAGLREQVPELQLEGVGGPQMQAAGFDSLVPMERLSVMGLVEVLRHLPELLRLRRQLREHWLRSPPDLFIGIDAPDFNLPLARRLRRAGIRTVHYVSPTVWAWRQGRVHGLRQAVDLLLSIFPFELPFLEAHGVPVRFVGHPLAAEMPLEPDRSAARQALDLAGDTPVLAVLPGSRNSELDALGADFLAAAARCAAHIPGLQVVVPLAREAHVERLAALRRAAGCPLQPLVRVGESRRMLAAADLVLTASGTATFETLLSKRPMVVGYRLHWLTYRIAKTLRLVKTRHIAMANLLADERLAPELLQDACTPQALADALLALHRDPARVAAIQARYTAIHQGMVRDSNREAAAAVLALLRDPSPASTRR